MREDDELVDELAAAIADGADIDWANAESRAAATPCPVMRELRLLESVASLHRGLHQSEATGHGRRRALERGGRRRALAAAVFGSPAGRVEEVKESHMTPRRSVRSKWPAVVAAWLVLTSPSVPAAAQTMLYALASDFACGTPSCPRSRLIQIDVERQVIVGDRPVDHSPVTRPRVTADGRHLVWFGSEGGSTTAWALNLFDLSTGVQTVSFTAEVPGGGNFTLHPSLIRGFFQLALYGPVVVAEPGGTRVLPTPCSHPFLSGRSGDGRRLSYYCGDERAVVTAVDTRTLATIGQAEIPVGREQLVGMALGPRPPQVSDLTATVQQATATLSWTIAAGALATHQLLEVGFGPGRTDASLVVAAGVTSLTRDGVPPGRYYVRVRSVNGTGPGTPSNEVIVDVP